MEDGRTMTEPKTDDPMHSSVFGNMSPQDILSQSNA
jgi:hypothetical protein